MDNTPKSKIMSKDEVALLIDLIQINPVLTSKETNATTNKTKEDTWTALVSAFNAKSGSIPRTKDQLKFKWDNLKKSVRKRTQHFIAPDEILETVSSLLRSTCTGFKVPFGGDGVGCGNVVVLDADNMTDIGSSLYEGVVSNDAQPNIPDDVEVLFETPSRGTQNRKRKIEVNEKSKHFFGMPISDELKTIKKGKNKADNDGRLARNLAIARYYDKRTEKLDLEMKVLRSELDQKENRNCNVINYV